MALTKVTNRMIDGAALNVLDYGADPLGVTDSTSAFQAAIDAAQGEAQVYIPSGTYKITDTLNLYKGSNIIGINKTQGFASYAAGAQGSKIVFSPSSEKDLFDIQNLPAPVQPWKSKVSVGGLWIDGNTTGGGTNSRYCFSLNLVIYSYFFDLEIRYFQSGFNVIDTINNRFENIRVANTSVSCVEYSGTAPPTTDVWDQCTFTDSPIGVRLSSGIAIRFLNCLLENIETFGVDVAKECAHIMWSGTYAENIPTTSATGSVFLVGSTGTVSSLNNSLQIIGGKFAGNNYTIQGSFIHTHETYGVLVSNVAVSRFTNVIKSEASTIDAAICCSGIQFLSSTNFATDTSKLEGFLDYQGINSATRPLAFFAGVESNSLSLTDGITAPSTNSSVAQLYVDSSDGDLKIKFGDGTVKTIVTDT
jgi:hypothetical protein